jgi:hypothetical protein
MLNITFGAAGAASHYDSGSTKLMRLLTAPAPQHWFLETANEINKKHYVIGIFLDLKKAFDVVLKKLEKMGIVGLALRWFASYTWMADLNVLRWRGNFPR